MKFYKKRTEVFQWLAAEPFRLFFLTGMLWSMAAASLWPLYYAGKLTYYPNLAHARLMIQAFGGAFVIGFLGTAGPRMVSAPALTPRELGLLLILHMANGLCLLWGNIGAGDAFFLGLLIALLGSLGARIIFFRREPPPPQLLLALVGLLCGLQGTAMFLSPSTHLSLPSYRLAGLLLYQGLLLLPALGIGAFFFPRILGGSFGGASTAAEGRGSLARAGSAAFFLLWSFGLEAWGWPGIGAVLRAGTCAAYLLAEVRWRRAAGEEPRGSLATGLFWALAFGACGLVLPGFFAARRIALEHLLFLGGFALLVLVVGSRVLFGHSGDADGFSRRSRFVRALVVLVLLTALTRALADFFPNSMISHHNYVAWMWAIAALSWLCWHRKRFFRGDQE